MERLVLASDSHFILSNRRKGAEHMGTHMRVGIQMLQWELKEVSIFS